MSKKLKNIVFLMLLCASFRNLQAQVSSKITLTYHQQGKLPANIGFLKGLFGKPGQVWNDPDIKIKEKDSPYNGDVFIEAKLKHDSVKFVQINSMEIPDSFQVNLCGVYKIRSYDLTEEEKNKKIIMRTTGPNASSICKVMTDSLNQKYVEILFADRCVTIPDEMIESIHVANYDYWADSEKEKMKIIAGYDYTRNMGFFTRFLIITGGILGGFALAK